MLIEMGIVMYMLHVCESYLQSLLPCMYQLMAMSCVKTYLTAMFVLNDHTNIYCINPKFITFTCALFSLTEKIQLI